MTEPDNEWRLDKALDGYETFMDGSREVILRFSSEGEFLFFIDAMAKGTITASTCLASQAYGTPPPSTHVLPPVVTGQMEIEPDVTAADLGVNTEPPEPDDLREEMRLAAASIRQWMPETLPANEAGQIHFARLLAESAAEAIEQFLATTEGKP